MLTRQDLNDLEDKHQQLKVAKCVHLDVFDVVLFSFSHIFAFFVLLKFNLNVVNKYILHVIVINFRSFNLIRFNLII